MYELRLVVLEKVVSNVTVLGQAEIDARHASSAVENLQNAHYQDAVGFPSLVTRAGVAVSF
jgi:hypothetical protein